MSTFATPARRSPIPPAAPLSPAEATEALRTLCLCDLSTLAKLGVKGPGAEAWLRGQQIDVPPATYDTHRLADGGRVIRLGSADFFLEAGASDLLTRLDAALASAPPHVYRVERQDATFVLGGERAVNVLAQLCSFDFRSAPTGRLVLTRAGGVNCAVLPETAGEVLLIRLWVDYTYAAAFWEMLAQISEELGGRVVAAAVLPDSSETRRTED